MLLSFILSTFTLIGFSQKRIVEKTLLSSKDSLAVSFANISIKNTKIGTYSDITGKFSIECSGQDSIIISSIGYRNGICDCTDSIDTIFLDEAITMLQEIVIGSNQLHFKTKKEGYFNDKRTGAYTGPNAVALYIENTSNIDGQISKIFFLLSKVKWIYDKPKPQFYRLLVRLKLYNKQIGSNAPHLNILREDIIKEVSEKQTKIVFDIEKLDITFPSDGIFIGIEFLGYYLEDSFIPFSSNDDNKRMQYKVSFSDGYKNSKSWTRLDYNNSWKPFDVGSNPFPNFNFGVVLKYQSP